MRSIQLIVIGLAILTMATQNAYAEKIPQNLVEAYEKDSANIIVVGKAAPSTVFNEMRAAAAELKKARESLKWELSKSSNMLRGFKEEIIAAEKQLRTAMKNMAKVQMDTADNLAKVQRSIEDLRHKVYGESLLTAEYLDRAFAKISELNARLTVLEESKSWGIGLHVSTNFDWSTEREDWAQFNTIGISAYWANTKILMSADISAGVNSLAKNLSWNFGASIEWRINSNWSFGGGSLLTQDLGNMEGADKMTWTVGPKIRFMLPKSYIKRFSIALSPIQFGAQGKRGYDGARPTWSPNIGALLTLDYFML